MASLGKKASRQVVGSIKRELELQRRQLREGTPLVVESDELLAEQSRYMLVVTNGVRDAHTFLTNIGNAAVAPYAVGAQTQMAGFFASNGTVVIDPDGAGPFFEVPIQLPLPEGLNFIP